LFLRVIVVAVIVPPMSETVPEAAPPLAMVRELKVERPPAWMKEPSPLFPTNELPVTVSAPLLRL